jgi:tetratricopeptide (TPR) repeat protein
MKEFGKENYYNMRGIILITTGRQPDAINDFDTCLGLNPGFEVAWINRAIAKVNSNNGEELKDYTIKADESLAFNVNWSLPEKKSHKNNSENLRSAMEDCNRAIQLNPKDDYALYVRGRLSRLLGYGNYCSDLLKAKELGFPVEQKYLKECGE